MLISVGTMHERFGEKATKYRDPCQLKHSGKSEGQSVNAAQPTCNPYGCITTKQSFVIDTGAEIIVFLASRSSPLEQS